jgi:cytochrome c-type biogenesis protein CcmE
MALLGGIVGKILGLLLLVAVLLVSTVVFLYATDYAVEATVTDKNCQSQPATVTVQTKFGGLVETVPVTATECFVIQKGNFVEYHIQSKRTVIYERDPATGGRCVYDTESKIC